MSVFLLATKLHIPRPQANGVSRPRLTEKLRAGMKQAGKCALVSGPAGFGKTTLLSESVAELQQPVAWVSLDEADNDPIRFWTYLITACQSVGSEIGKTALSLLQTPQPFSDDHIPTILINDIDSSDADLVLVLDDYHTIQNQTIHSAICFLLDHLPDHLHIVISTRVDPPWPLARLRARNQLVEIRAADLRFTAEETALFLDQVMGLKLSAEDVAALEARTEGWIASLQLAAISMKGRSDVTGFIKAFTGSHVYVAEYLIEEVLERQPEEVKTFLLQTSILERLSAALCETVSGRADSQDVLKYLYQSNLFVHPLDDEGQWFRYHRLFADLLRARLQQSVRAEEIKTLHQRAADWFEQMGMTNEAMDHLLAAADYARAVALLEEIVPHLILKAYFKTVDDWLQVIPSEAVQASARLNMTFAWMYLMRRDAVQAAPYLQQLQILFSQPDANRSYTSLQGEWLALRSILMGAQGKVEESRDLAEQALKSLPEDRVQVRIMTYMGLANAYRQMLDYERATESSEAMIQESRKAGDLASEVFGLSFQALVVLQEGRLHSAHQIALQGLRLVERSGSSSPFSATLYGELAQVYYHWHRLEEARVYFERSVKWSLPGGFSDAEIYHSVFLSRLFQMEGNLQESVREIEKAVDLMQTAAPSLVGEEVVAQQVSIFLRLDRLAAAQSALKTYGFGFEDELSFPEIEPATPLAHPLGLLYNSALRALFHQAQKRDGKQILSQGIELASLVIQGSFRARHLPIVLQTLLLRAQLYTAIGDHQAGLADVARALELAEPEGFISIFLEEGQLVAQMITTLFKRQVPASVKPAYIKQILAAGPKSHPSDIIPNRVPAQDLAPIEQLTPREFEVLQLIAAGDSNQAIADKLVITISAVKKHTGNIFHKLNVNNRTLAVVRARQAGILSTDG